MPNSIPPNQPPDLYTLIFNMNENMGRNTQMVADTRDTVSDIKTNQQTQILKLTQLESNLTDIQNRHTELKARVDDHDKRTEALEDAEKRRKWVIGLVVGAMGLGTTFLGWLVLNWAAISRVFHGE